MRVNAVIPGPVLTDYVASIQDQLAPLLARVPSGRASAPEEVSEAVTFLASARAGNIHGVTLAVDGGLGVV